MAEKSIGVTWGFNPFVITGREPTLYVVYVFCFFFCCLFDVQSFPVFMGEVGYECGMSWVGPPFPEVVTTKDVYILGSEIPIFIFHDYWEGGEPPWYDQM